MDDLPVSWQAGKTREKHIQKHYQSNFTIYLNMQNNNL